MATPQQAAQIQKAIQVATDIDKKKEHIKSFAIFAVICGIFAINYGLKQYDTKYDIVQFISGIDMNTKKYMHYAIALAGIGLFYYAYQLYPLVKMM